MMKGFIVFDYADKYDMALKDLSTWLTQGKIKRKEHIVGGGLEAAPQGLVRWSRWHLLVRLLARPSCKFYITKYFIVYDILS